MNLGFETFIKDVKEYAGEPKCILDVGSRDCDESLEFLRIFPSAEIHAFEPSFENHKICQAAIEGSSIKLWKIALSDKNQIVDFYYTIGNIGASSLARPYEVPWTGDQRVLVEKVECMTLDRWAQINGVHPDVLWVDVQSQELPFFVGGRQTLKKVKAIYTEAGLVPYYEGHTMSKDIIKELESQGFYLLRDEKDWEKETNLTFVRK